MPEAWTIRTATEGSADSDPIAWLKSVLPRIREPYQGNYGRARKALREGDFDPQTTVFAVDDRGPVGITVVQGEVDHLQVLLVGVRGDRRRRGRGGGAQGKWLPPVGGPAAGGDQQRVFRHRRAGRGGAAAPHASNRTIWRTARPACRSSKPRLMSASVR